MKFGHTGERKMRGGMNGGRGGRRGRKAVMCMLILFVHICNTTALSEDSLKPPDGKKDDGQGDQCGRPGRPANGTVSTSGRFYFPGERVAYKCLEGFVLVGPEERTCQRDGTWSDDVPLCDFNLARGKRTLQSATLWSYTPDLAVDGNPDTCCFTPRGPDARWWQVHLGHKFTVLSVGVTISPGSPQEFTIFVIELLTDNKALYKPCANFKGVFQTHKAVFQCNGGVGHPGQFVYIRDDRDDHEYFGLCEVEVFAFRERIPCGEPEVPVEGEVEREGDRAAIFSCRPGYTLEGDAKLTCSSKGTWQGQPPKCKETQCPTPPSISHGSLEVANFRGVYGHGTVVTYTCGAGYILDGPASATCDHTATWTNPTPTCKAVWCGSPPSVAHASYTLLNTSTGIAVYTCHPGHLLSQDSTETVTTCNDSGVWQPINITCVAVTTSQTRIVGQGQINGRDGEGRALNYDLAPATSDPDPDGPRGLVAALALVAGLLTAAMLVVGGLLARRPLMAHLRPFLNTTPSKTPAATSTTPAAGRPSPRHPHITHPTQTAHIPSTYPHSPSYTHSYTHNQDNHSGYNPEPPYDRVGNRSEHSYETLRRKSCVADRHSETGSDSEVGTKEAGYETVSELGVREPGYEVVRETSMREGEGREAGYETVKEVSERNDDADEGYETVKEKNETDEDEREVEYETVREVEGTDAEYETVREKEEKGGGYETVKERGEKDAGYETVKEKGEKEAGYETVKDKDAGYETVKETRGREGERRGSVKLRPPTPPRVPPPRSLTPLGNHPRSPTPSIPLPRSPTPSGSVLFTPTISNPLPFSPNSHTRSVSPPSSLPRSLTPSNSLPRSPSSPPPLPPSPSPLPPSPSPLPGSPTPDDSVPDILQHLSTPTDQVPPEILALYARVDKSKKRRKDPAPSPSSSTSSYNFSTLSSNNNSNSNPKKTTTSAISNSNLTGAPGKTDGTQRLVQKFSRMNSDEGSPRPLPPLPASPPPIIQTPHPR